MADIHTIVDASRQRPAEHLAHAIEDFNAASSQVQLGELDFPLQVGLRARAHSESAARLEDALGFPLPTRHSHVSGDADGLHVMWLSPDEFLAVDVSARQYPGDADFLINALDSLPGHAVDLSANRAVLTLEGERSQDVLDKGCHMDLDLRSFPVGTAVATGLGPVNVYLHRCGTNAWRIYPRASVADFMVRWLLDAGKEFTDRSPL